MNQEDKEGSRKGSPQVHVFQSYAWTKSSHKIAFDFLKFSEASEQQRAKTYLEVEVIYNNSIYTLKKLRCVPLNTPEFCDPPSRS